MEKTYNIFTIMDECVYSWRYSEDGTRGKWAFIFYVTNLKDKCLYWLLIIRLGKKINISNIFVTEIDVLIFDIFADLKCLKNISLARRNRTTNNIGNMLLSRAKLKKNFHDIVFPWIVFCAGFFQSAHH